MRASQLRPNREAKRIPARIIWEILHKKWEDCTKAMRSWHRRGAATRTVRMCEILTAKTREVLRASRWSAARRQAR